MITAAGVWFYCSTTDRCLYLLRNDPKHPYTWGLPGGKSEKSETLIQTLHRECEEEIGFFPEHKKIIPIEQFTSADKRFSFHTFFCVVGEEFVPSLNHEHLGYAWIESRTWPRPMHPGLWATVNFHEIIQKIETTKQNYTSQ